MHKGFNLSTSLSTLFIFCFLTIAILMGMEWDKHFSDELYFLKQFTHFNVVILLQLTK